MSQFSAQPAQPNGVWLKADMAKPDITAILKAAHELAESLAIRGTPAFVVGDEVYPGALDLPTLKRMVEQARKG